MSKENLLFGVIGLFLGAIIGFMFANSINKTALTSAPASTSALPMTGAAGPLPPGSNTMPADHPPIGTSGGQTGGAGAIAEVSAAIEKAKAEPQNYDAQMTAADLYYQIQRFDDAAKFYEAAVKLKPESTEPLVKLGNALFDAEKYAEAEKWYTKALEKDPKNITVRTDLGLTFYLREPRDIPSAIKEYEKSLAIDQNHEITLQNMALAYRDANDTANLQKTIAKLKAVNPKNPALPQLEGRSATP